VEIIVLVNYLSRICTGFDISSVISRVVNLKA